MTALSSVRRRQLWRAAAIKVIDDAVPFLFALDRQFMNKTAHNPMWRWMIGKDLSYVQFGTIEAMHEAGTVAGLLFVASSFWLNGLGLGIEGSPVKRALRLGSLLLMVGGFLVYLSVTRMQFMVSRFVVGVGIGCVAGANPAFRVIQRRGRQTRQTGPNAGPEQRQDNHGGYDDWLDRGRTEVPLLRSGVMAFFGMVLSYVLSEGFRVVGADKWEHAWRCPALAIPSVLGLCILVLSLLLSGPLRPTQSDEDEKAERAAIFELLSSQNRPTTTPLVEGNGGAGLAKPLGLVVAFQLWQHMLNVQYVAYAYLRIV